MTDPTTLEELAVRCEKAEGRFRDRELDEAICAAVGLIEYDNGCPKWTRVFQGRAAGAIAFADAIPSYSASIDAAATLVPDGYDVSLYWGLPGFKPQAQLETEATRRAEWMDLVNGEAATPALALCAASLRARAAAGEFL